MIGPQTLMTGTPTSQFPNNFEQNIEEPKQSTKTTKNKHKFKNESSSRKI